MGKHSASVTDTQIVTVLMGSWTHQRAHLLLSSFLVNFSDCSPVSSRFRVHFCNMTWDTYPYLRSPSGTGWCKNLWWVISRYRMFQEYDGILKVISLSSGFYIHLSAKNVTTHSTSICKYTNNVVTINIYIYIYIYIYTHTHNIITYMLKLEF